MTSVHYAVLTHNRPHSLAALLESIAAQSERAETAITIFDNGSAGAQADAVSRLGAAYDATLIRHSSNSFMAGRPALEDHVFERGHFDVLVHLDDDVVLRPGWLAAVLRGLEAGATACGSVEDRDGDAMLSGQRTVAIAECLVGGRPIRIWDWNWHSPRVGAASEPVEFAGHRALAVTAAVARAARHDPTLIAGGDDIDYSLTLRRAGNELRIANDAVIVHRSRGEPDVTGRAVWRSFGMNAWASFGNGRCA